MTVLVKTTPDFILEKPKTLYRGTYIYADFVLDPYEFNTWDINPDGKRFLMMKEAEATDDESTEEIPRKINIVLNWFEELKEQVPVP